MLNVEFLGFGYTKQTEDVSSDFFYALNNH